MRVVGIIAEYNPFHLGHEYQIRKARQKWGEDTAIVVVMSGDFVQRGEPAIATKVSRTKAALASGADLVLCLPFTFACASADRFASGAIDTLDATGIVSDIYFGSECPDIHILEAVADVWAEEPVEVSLLITEAMRDGSSYAAARQASICRYLANRGNETLAQAAATFLSSPNVILGIEYLASIRRNNSRMRASLLERKGAGYHEIDPSSVFPSATALRNIVTNDCAAGVFDISSAARRLQGKMPESSLAELLTEYSNGCRPVFPSDFTEEILFAIRRTPVDSLRQTAYMGDCVAERLKNAVASLPTVKTADLYTTFTSVASTKRFAGTRINRAIVSLLIGQTTEDIHTILHPSYLRVLGFSDIGKYLLRRMRKSSTLPVLDKASDFLEYGDNSQIRRTSELDLIAADLRSVKAGQAYGNEFREKVVPYKSKKFKGTDL